MTDPFSKEQRSEIMKRVRSSGNRSTELRLIEIFKEHKIVGWRRNYRLFGNPDFAFPKYKIVIFTDGCFWHGHNCRNVSPTANAEYWKKKIERNQNRDLNVNDQLTKKGWTVIRIWECNIRRGAIDEITSLKKGMSVERANEGKR